MEIEKWVHAWDVKAIVANELDSLARYRHQVVEISVRRHTEDDGCWCYTEPGKAMAEIRIERMHNPQPHAHDPGLGKCPPRPAFGDYVYLKLEAK